MKIDYATKRRLGLRQVSLPAAHKMKTPGRNGRGRTIGEQVQALVLRAKRLEKDMWRHARKGQTAKADRLARELVRVRESTLALMAEADRRGIEIVLDGTAEGERINRPCVNPTAYAKAKGIQI